MHQDMKYWGGSSKGIKFKRGLHYNKVLKEVCHYKVCLHLVTPSQRVTFESSLNNWKTSNMISNKVLRRMPHYIKNFGGLHSTASFLWRQTKSLLSWEWVAERTIKFMKWLVEMVKLEECTVYYKPKANAISDSKIRCCLYYSFLHWLVFKDCNNGQWNHEKKHIKFVGYAATYTIFSVPIKCI